MIYIITGPSGVGKTSLCDELVTHYPSIFERVISHTTRPPREGEKDGVDYHFVGREFFEKNEFLAEVESPTGMYGFSRNTLMKRESPTYKSKLLIADHHGAVELKRHMDCKLVFILPGSWEECLSRISGRGNVEKRMAYSKEMLSFLHHYDYALVNDKTLNHLVVEFVSLATTQEMLTRYIVSNNRVQKIREKLEV